MVRGATFVLIALSALAGLSGSPTGRACGPGTAKNRPGWADVFARLNMYQASYDKPVVGPGEKPQVYRQRAVYQWIGNRYEQLEITLARDPAFKDRYAADVLRKEQNPPRPVTVHGKSAWRWDLPRGCRQVDPVVRRLVVLLDADKAIILEQRGSGASLEDVAGKFDFARVAQALAQPPRSGNASSQARR